MNADEKESGQFAYWWLRAPRGAIIVPSPFSLVESQLVTVMKEFNFAHLRKIKEEFEGKEHREIFAAKEHQRRANLGSIIKIVAHLGVCSASEHSNVLSAVVKIC